MRSQSWSPMYPLQKCLTCSGHWTNICWVKEEDVKWKKWHAQRSWGWQWAWWSEGMNKAKHASTCGLSVEPRVLKHGSIGAAACLGGPGGPSLLATITLIQPWLWPLFLKCKKYACFLFSKYSDLNIYDVWSEWLILWINETHWIWTPYYYVLPFLKITKITTASRLTNN